jgi:uncharacterized protein (TIGR00297 family)
MAAPSGPLNGTAEVHQTDEGLRKLLHIGFGFGAVSLRWLPWQVAAVIAAAAVVGNWLVLHRVFGRGVARHERGYDAGIVLYPFVVLALILAFRHHLAAAAVCWAILGFGDGFATVVGKRFPASPRLPWNRQKSWAGFAAFVIAAAPAAYAVWLLVDDSPLLLPRLAVVLVTVVTSAIAESLVTNIDDNLIVPIAAAVTFSILAGATSWPVLYTGRTAILWLAANALLAAIGYVLKSVDLSGAVGGWLLGAILIVCGGWPLFVTLLAFFVIGTATTKLGFSRKAALGLAQERGGRRSFSHAFSNTGMASICALAISLGSGGTRESLVLRLAAIASLATAAADTVASEIGQLLGRRAFLPTTLRPVPVGTEGAISVEGSVAGFAGALLVAAIGLSTLLVQADGPALMEAAGVPPGAATLSWLWPPILLITLCACAGSYLESVAGAWNRRQARPVPNGVLNFFNTAVGAILVLWLASSAFPA